MHDIPAVIFAGGKSSRMGQDKALLPFGGEESLAAFQHKKLSSLFKEVYLSSKEEKFAFDAPVIYDKYAQSSPLVALVSIFETLDSDEVFILGVDIPFVDKEVIEALYQKRDASMDAVVAQSPQGLQPLCGFYRRTVLSKARENLRQDIHKLQHLLKEARTLPVMIQDEKAFINLNTPQEYQSALK